VDIAVIVVIVVFCPSSSPFLSLYRRTARTAIGGGFHRSNVPTSPVNTKIYSSDEMDRLGCEIWVSTVAIFLKVVVVV